MMTAIEALEKLRDYIIEKRDEVYSEMGFATEHKFQMELQALRYKTDIISDIDGEILMMLHKLYNEEEEDGDN